MPYAANSDLPKAIQSKYGKCSSAFRSAFNATYDKTSDEGRSFAAAHAAAKRCQQARKGADMAGVSLAAPKLPPLAPGDFRFVTKSLNIEGAAEDGGKRRFKTIASSTVKDMAGDEIKVSALEDMAASFRKGLNIFIEHKHDAEMIFGRSDTAEIKNSGELDDKGSPIWDLHIAGVVNEPNPRARQLADSIDGGYVTLGTSIGAFVKDYKRNADGGMDIYHVECKEGSIVGIPMNQRSWTYKAASAAAALEAQGVDGDEPDETPDVDDADVEPAKVEESPHEEVTPEVEKADATEIVTKADGACPKCGKGADADGDCDDSYHNTKEKSGGELVDPIESDATEDDTTPGGQEADAATPETAPTDGDEADPAVQKADDFAEEDVVALVQRAKGFAVEIGRLSEENAALKDEIAVLKAAQVRLADVEKDAVEAIEKVMALPLQRKAVGHVAEHVSRYPDIYDSRVTAYIERATKRGNASDT